MVWEVITDTPTIAISGILSTMIIMGTIHPIIIDPITTDLTTMVDIMDIHLTIMGMDITVMPLQEVRIMDTGWLHLLTVEAKWVQEQL